MDCDIRLFVEKKIDGSWEALKGVNEPRIKRLRSALLAWEDYGVAERLEESLREEQEGTYDFIDIPRNPGLYAVLVDVRNYDRIPPICAPRGLPSDVSAVVKEQADGWRGDGHDHSYLTVKELSDFDWNQEIKFRAVSGSDRYWEFLHDTSPTRWYAQCGYMYWVKTPKDYAGTFYTWSIPKLIELADGDLESVRIVFWFDN